MKNNSSKTTRPKHAGKPSGKLDEKHGDKPKKTVQKRGAAGPIIKQSDKRATVAKPQPKRREQSQDGDDKRIDINWYPGHMMRAKRQLEAKLKLIDLVIEVVDARAPRATRNPDFDPMFAGKARLVVLNKCDLANDAVTRRWIRYFRAQGIEALGYSAVKSTAGALLKAIESVAAPIYERYEQKGAHKVVRASVIGIPNVGKSAIINKLSGGGGLKVGNKPGVTRGLQWVKLSPYLELMDTPGMLWPKIDNEKNGASIALIGSIKTEVTDPEQLCVYLLDTLRTTEPELLKMRYKLETLGESSLETMTNICKQRGFLRGRGEYDYERCALTVLDEYKNGKLGSISLETPDTEAPDAKGVETE